jgi:hypothetical protein
MGQPHFEMLTVGFGNFGHCRQEIGRRREAGSQITGVQWL